jgi:hypothetical protein
MLSSAATMAALKGFWVTPAAQRLEQHKEPCLYHGQPSTGNQQQQTTPAASIFSRADVLNCSALMVSGKGSSPSPSTCHDTMPNGVQGPGNCFYT